MFINVHLPGRNGIKAKAVREQTQLLEFLSNQIMSISLQDGISTINIAPFQHIFIAIIWHIFLKLK